MNFKGIFAKANRALSADRPQFSSRKKPGQSGGNPQYETGVEPAGSAQQPGAFRPGSYNASVNYVRPSHPAVVTPGFDDCGCDTFALHYSERAQPDVGGALNFSYDSYGLPLQQPAGAFMVARMPFMPIGSQPLQAWPISVPTGAGLFPGQMISQPLLNPQGPNSGFDIYS